MADVKITALTNYTPAIDTDVLPIVDITTSTTKKITWANVKGTLKTYFDTLYGTGTVTAVSVATANGFSGTSSGGATPALTVIAGAIVPTTVNGHTLTTGSSTFTGTAAQTYTFPSSTSTLLATDGSAASLTSFPTLNQNTTGSAATLTTPRAINGTNFDGSAAITVTAASSTLTGTVVGSGTSTSLAASILASSLTSVGTITTGVWTGTDIAIADGGTGAGVAATAFNNLSPMTTGGDVIYGGASGAGTRLANGTEGQVLTSGGTTVAPTWTSPAGGGDMVLASVQTVTGAKTFGTIGGAVGKFILAGSTSGSSILDATAIAGTTTVTLPAATDTLVGKATTDTLTNKTIDADGTGNSITNIEDANIKAAAAIAVNKLAALTASEIVISDASGFIASAAVATYPSLTELIHVKGVTSAIQTQLTARLPLTGGTMTGNITLGENVSIALDPAGSADGKYSGLTIAGTAGATLAFGDLIYLAVADSRWELTDADATATAGTPMIGMCVLAAAADADPTVILLMGIIRADAKFPALTIGAPAYVGETAGLIQVAIPTGADNVIRVVGRAMTADELYFNPSMDHQISVA